MPIDTQVESPAEARAEKVFEEANLDHPVFNVAPAEIHAVSDELGKMVGIRRGARNVKDYLTGVGSNSTKQSVGPFDYVAREHGRILANNPDATPVDIWKSVLDDLDRILYIAHQRAEGIIQTLTEEQREPLKIGAAFDRGEPTIPPA